VYMAPELMHADSATSLCSGSIDIYSFGIPMCMIRGPEEAGAPAAKRDSDMRVRVWADSEKKKRTLGLFLRL
jgi:hypothetical protein